MKYPAALLMASSALLPLACGRMKANAPPPLQHDVTVSFMLLEVIDSGTVERNRDGTITWHDGVTRLRLEGDVEGEITVHSPTETANMATQTVSSAGAVTSGEVTLVSTGQQLSSVSGRTASWLSNMTTQLTLDSGFVELDVGECPLLRVTGGHQIVNNQTTILTGKWTEC